MEKITKSSKSILIDPNEPLILPDGTALVGRIEWFLYALCCLDYQNLPTPMSRIEEFANALITGEIPNIEPQSRAEQFFLAILDGNVSNLPQPQSRSEVLLDKLARGEFDLSDVEPIQSRYELLLAYLIKNGGIGNIDYVLYEFSEAMKTMYNTVEKPFKSLELSGNTLVNCVLEDTENDDYTSFDKDYSGTSFTINETSEGAIKSAILKGQTLKEITNNLFDGEVEDGDYDINTGEKRNYSNRKRCANKIKINPSTTYTLSGITWYLQYDENGDYLGSASTNDKRLVFTSKNNAHYLTFYNINNESGFFVGLGDTEPLYELVSVKMPVLTTTGKNLIDNPMIIDQGVAYELTNPIYVKNGDKLTFIVKGLSTNINDYQMFVFGDTSDISLFNSITHTGNGSRFLEDELQTITLTASKDGEIKYFKYANSGYSATANIEKIMLCLGEGESYEPYKSNILSCNEDVILRGINNKKDTLDYNSGIKTEMIGEMVLKGTENYTQWTVGNQTAEGMIGIYTRKDTIDATENDGAYILCDKLPIVYRTNLQNTTENSVIKGNGYIGIVMKANSVDEVKAWLRENPVTVQYGLKSAVNKEVQIDIVDQNNTKIDKIHVFNGTTHVNASSDELTPTVNIGKSVSYPTIIKPNIKYTVDLKRNDKPLTVDLGGTEVAFASGETRKVITTPNTLTNDKLSYYGVGAKCNEIMLIEGEVEGNVDYFTGMKSVVMQNQMPILSTVGKNLFDVKCVGEELNKIKPIIIENNSLTITSHSSYHYCCKYRPINFEPNKQYTLSANIESNSSSIGTVLGFCYTDGSFTYISKQKQILSSNIDKTIDYITFSYGIVGIQEIWSNIQLEEGSVATSYEPYKTSILSYSDDVTLHGIENIQDTLNCLTGEVVERIGEIVLDGSEGRWDLAQDRANTMRFNCFNLDIPIGVNGSLLKTDKFPYQSPTANDQEGAVMGGGVVTPRVPSISILKTRLPSNDIDGFKQWLSQNPITVQYRLATESIKIVDLDVVDQDGNAIPKIKSYKDVTHLEVTVPKQSLLPHISAEVATDNSKDMSSLATKHQEISEAQSAIQDNIQFQSDEIDTAMMATTEIFESILE